MAHDVFISHSTRDKHITDQICHHLEQEGIRCWMAPRDILPGRDWPASIVDAITQSSLMLLIFSENANESAQIYREIGVASEERVPVVPFRIQEIQPSKNLRYFLSTPHWLDALPPPATDHLEYLTDTLRRLLPDHKQTPEIGPQKTEVTEVQKTEEESEVEEIKASLPEPGLAESEIEGAENENELKPEPESEAPGPEFVREPPPIGEPEKADEDIAEDKVQEETSDSLSAVLDRKSPHWAMRTFLFDERVDEASNTWKILWSMSILPTYCFLAISLIWALGADPPEQMGRGFVNYALLIVLMAAAGWLIALYARTHAIYGYSMGALAAATILFYYSYSVPRIHDGYAQSDVFFVVIIIFFPLTLLGLYRKAGYLLIYSCLITGAIFVYSVAHYRETPFLLGTLALLECSVSLLALPVHRHFQITDLAKIEGIAVEDRPLKDTTIAEEIPWYRRLFSYMEIGTMPPRRSGSHRGPATLRQLRARKVILTTICTSFFLAAAIFWWSVSFPEMKPQNLAFMICLFMGFSAIGWLLAFTAQSRPVFGPLCALFASAYISMLLATQVRGAFALGAIGMLIIAILGLIRISAFLSICSILTGIYFITFGFTEAGPVTMVTAAALLFIISGFTIFLRRGQIGTNRKAQRKEASATGT
jgi:TIR domain